MKRKLSFGGTEIPEKTQDEKDEACSAKICQKPTGERIYVHEDLMKIISVNWGHSCIDSPEVWMDLKCKYSQKTIHQFVIGMQF